MCLIIHQPSGIPIPEEYLSNALLNNPDGWGIVSGRHVARGLDPASFWDAWEQIEDTETFLHFRYATHGKVDLSNCHPFTILRGRYHVLHNGVIQVDCPDRTKSDTWHFAQRVIAPALRAHPERFGSVEFTEYLSPYLKGSKLVITRRDGASMILNREQGIEDHGLWLSNSYSIEKPIWSLGESGRNTWDDLETYTLDDLASLSREELTKLCESDPDLIASLIDDHLRYTRRSRRDYR